MNQHPLTAVRIPSFFAFLLLVLFGSIAQDATAQATSSPYSRYGIGDVTGRVFAQGSSMGGVNIGMQNDTIPMFFINTANPASYPTIRLTTAELGINYNRLVLESSTNKSTVHSASLGYISLGFPIKKWWGASIGLIPFSNVGYKVSDHQDITNIGGVDFLYEGSGGIDQVYFGNGIKPLYGLYNQFLNSKKYEDLKQAKDFASIARIAKRKKSLQGLSIGANVSYLFGNFEHIRRSIFEPAGLYFNTRTDVTTHVNDIYMDYGLQYAFIIDSLHGRDLKDNVKVTIGATFAAQTKVNANIDSLSVNYFYNSIGTEIVKDTIESTQGYKGTFNLPLSYGVGFSIKKGQRWLVAGDIALQNWSTFSAFDQNPGLRNSMRVSLGGQYVPNAMAVGDGNYVKRINYRMGLRYAQTALELKTTQLVEYGVSVGFGFPVGRNYLFQNFSMVNIGAEFGQRGTTTNGLIKENFMKVTLGFTINDRWFVKPKYD